MEVQPNSRLYAALAKAQSEIKSIKKTGLNPHFKSAYVELNEACDYVLPILSKYELSITQVGVLTEDRLILKTTMAHSSGESIESLWPVCLLTAKPQEIGSSTSYARRYALMAITGLSANDDDDGNEAQAKHQAPSTTAAVIEKDPPPMPPSKNNTSYRGPSEAQIKRLYAIASSSGWPPGMVNAYVKRGYEKKPSELIRSEYDAVCDSLKSLKFSDIIKEELKPFMSIDIKAEFEKAKKQSYVDHTKTPLTPPPFDDGENLPF